MILSSRPNPLFLAIGVASALLTVFSLVFYWYLIVLIGLGVFGARLGYYRGYIQPKIAKINRSQVVKVVLDENDFFYPIPLQVKEENKPIPSAYYKIDWLFNIFYFLVGKKEWQVRTILPEMQEYEVILAESYYALADVQIAVPADNDLDYQSNFYLAYFIKNIFKKVQPKLNILKEKSAEIKKELDVIVLSPQIYQKKIELYSKLKQENKKLIADGEVVKEIGLDIIRDVSIGTDLEQIAPADLAGIGDKKQKFDRQCKIFLEKYQNLKEKIDGNFQITQKY
ncbi:MAG: hypothetical protein QNJ38_17205 [Prochloraceae cyanobacterium]|nr:hypothetical protein [Prochloraceae cyanobacterium]